MTIFTIASLASIASRHRFSSLHRIHEISLATLLQSIVPTDLYKRTEMMYFPLACLLACFFFLLLLLLLLLFYVLI